MKSISNDQTASTPTTTEDLRRKLVSLESSLSKKSDILRKLKTVRIYKTKNDIIKLDDSIQNWRQIAQASLVDLKDLILESNKGSRSCNGEPMLKKLIDELKIDPKLLKYDEENDGFEAS